MPLYDRGCACGWRAIDVWEPVTMDHPPPCPSCGAATTRMWLTPATVRGDECDVTVHNGTRVPIRFRSKAEYRRWMHAEGLESSVQHVPIQGTDRSPHTTNWAATYDPYTAKNVRELLERAFQGGRAPSDAPDAPIPVAVTVGDYTPCP